MKTLDEVIRDVAKRRDLDNDIYHYLKEYQTLQYGYIKAMADLEDNPPLTWDELKQMRGKPVWIEEIGQKYSSSHWEIHNGIEDAYDGDEILYLQPFFETETKNSLGKTWNAYRKERINDVSRNND